MFSLMCLDVVKKPASCKNVYCGRATHLFNIVFVCCNHFCASKFLKIGYVLQMGIKFYKFETKVLTKFTS